MLETPKKMEQTPVVLRGETTLYGRLMCIGGTNPFFVLRLDNGTIFPCECNVEFVKQLERANKLYEVIGVTGTAQWSSETLQLLKFHAAELLSYRENSIVEAFEELRHASNGVFDAVDDVEAYVRSIRYGEELQEA